MEYRKFIGIDYSPNYELQLKEVSQEKADIDGIDDRSELLEDCCENEKEWATQIGGMNINL